MLILNAMRSPKDRQVMIEMFAQPTKRYSLKAFNCHTGGSRVDTLSRQLL
jgi:hypothetical protein